MDNQSQLANQRAERPDTPSVEQTYARSILDPILAAEQMHPAGTYDHGQVLGAALVSKWPQIKIMLMRAAGNVR